MKIALVKQDVYQDLYVAALGATPYDLLASTLMRVGPLGLFTLLGADFHIVKESSAKECRVYRKLHDPGQELREQLKSLPANQIKASFFRFLEPLSSRSHADFAVEADSVDWSRYDIVISINIAVPTSVVQAHPRVLWCYMMGEAGWVSDEADFGYDVCLTQNVTGAVASRPGIVDFPYTFLGPRCLEDLLARSPSLSSVKSGIYAEINCTTERPVTIVPQFEPLRRRGHEVRVHSQNILENLARVHQSKYFVKWGGRSIRGNSVIEAISCGTLVLMDPQELTHSQLLPPETWITDFEQLARLIERLEADAGLYSELVAKQRTLLEQFVWKAPLLSLENCLRAKRAGVHVDRKSLVKKLKQRLKKWLLY